MFVDRIPEQKKLQEEYTRKEASFVVIYGRRRLGKSTLIQEFCKDKNTLAFLATEESEQQNLLAFQTLVADKFHDELLRTAQMTRWESVFDTLSRDLPPNERLVLVIDEFQYLGKANPAFPSVFMRIWEENLKKQNIMLIVCGSLINMMTSQLLNYDSPLYGRRTAQIRMLQIPFRYYGDFMPNLSVNEQVLFYAVTGGVPKYIELFSGEKDIYEAIDENIINTNSFLYAEPEFLLQKEVSEIGSYFSLLRIIAAGAHRLSEIGGRMSIKQTSLPKYLKTLEELDIITRETPITEENPEKSKMGQYQIKDHFIRFWFRFIYPYRGQIESGNSDYVRNLIRQHFIENHVSYVYEEICRQRIWSMTKELPPITRVGRWWDNKNAEIDVLAYNSEGNDMIFGECKFSEKPKDASLLWELQRKAQNVKWKQDTRQEYFVIFSRSGFTKELKDIAKKEKNVVLVK